MQLTFTPEAENTLAAVIDCLKSVAMYGANPYIAREKQLLAIRLVDLLIESNADDSGLTAMNAEVEARKADVDGQYAEENEQRAIASDRHCDANKAQAAYLKQALAAIKMDLQATQVEEFRA